MRNKISLFCFGFILQKVKLSIKCKYLFWAQWLALVVSAATLARRLQLLRLPPKVLKMNEFMYLFFFIIPHKYFILFKYFQSCFFLFLHRIYNYATFLNMS